MREESNNINFISGYLAGRYNIDNISFLRVSLFVELIGMENAKEVLQYIEVNPTETNNLNDLIIRILGQNGMKYEPIVLALLDDFRKDMDVEEITACIKNILNVNKNENWYSYIFNEVKSNDPFAIANLESTVTNQEIINSLVVELFSQFEGQTILNADCGIGSFLFREYEKNKNIEIDGFCRNQKAYNIALARTYVSGDEDICVQRQDLFKSGEKKYDKIYLTYPWIEKYDIKSVTPIIFSSECAEYLTLARKYSPSMLGIACLMESLNYNGTMIAFVPDGGLINSIDTDIRKYLVKCNYLDTIISLPAGILNPYSAISCSLLILKKQRKETENVFMVNGEEAFQDLAPKKQMSSNIIKRIVKIILENVESTYKHTIKRTQIVSEGYYLNVQRYFEPEITLINPLRLKEVCKSIVRGCQVSPKVLSEYITENKSSTNYRIVNISDIAAEGYVKSNLTPVKIDDPKKFDKFCLEPGDLVITAKNTTFKSAVYEQEDDVKAIMTGNLVAIRLDQNKMNPYFLKAFLDSNAGQNVFASVQTGTTLKTLTVNNLAVMRVSCPSMGTQEKIAAAYKSKLSEVKEYITKYENAVDDLKKIYEKEV